MPDTIHYTLVIYTDAVPEAQTFESTLDYAILKMRAWLGEQDCKWVYSNRMGPVLNYYVTIHDEYDEDIEVLVGQIVPHDGSES